ncbi:transient receptor potential-gamma protein isoform X1 [Bombus pyrosoma]|uniref:transient receptor potential-gamma protein isoform X1 n=1 Tax=Bombus pyrosoma TaxID=396416 RepID=UPI001CB9D39A|nr:transient receptor potential-gamma protein isoform X1 [Bombus pyrosoma]XP_043598715.1 transient receptor potential-gamma protein isoform X1 [Bombus pyrosoma]XP_043598720.1 transient receptor potential-gamma protein isoform X1 [Bombus pyrosoma]XP_043598730.1 transient receptor potential-gamma protein isoform X1 [Bombus pyrosoma]XP_043598740.1 transient receptor potential-gamma protein isoform X1 [Bombus pyrosoma]XP_043598750.1 transient receptor potential-gamma protein isoform X1 [Bombus pyr
MDINTIRGWNSGARSGFLRGIGQRVSFDPEAPPLPPQPARKVDEKVKRHSIHGMIEEENVVRPHQEMASLSYQEKKYLLAVERGDVASVRRMLQSAHETEMNINCVDPLGRSALLMAIDNENLEMVELLIEHKVDTKDALLHAISEEFVEAVEVLLEHEESLHRNGEPHVSRFHRLVYSWEALPSDTATFTPDITPLILAAHRDNYEIIKILLDRGSTLPMPHDVRCGCDECVTSRREDSLRHSRSRINAYRALASPSLIALSSKDPILTAFELSWELRRLSFLEHEFKCEYQELRRQCQDFATALLDHTRSSYELEVLLNHDPTGPAFEHGERMHLNRLKLAIKLRQKKFVAHPNVQQLLASIWYEGLPGFRRKNMVLQALEIVRIGVLFPFFSVAYIIAPHSVVGQTMRKPFIKFICHSASYFTFLFMLILASQRIESVIGNWMGHDVIEHEPAPTKRGAAPTIVEWFILAWVSGLIWSEVKQLWDVGLEEYVNDMWNVIDFVTNSLYVATAALRVVAYYRVQKETQKSGSMIELQREQWDTWDPMLISEGLFSAANIFSSLKLVYIFSVNPHLGPLQVSLSRMVMDIMKFFFLYVLVLFAFSCGLNQLLWYYADMEKKRCPTAMAYSGNTNVTTDSNACIVWRRFANLFETAQTLFWAVFGLVDLESFELDGIKAFTRFWGMLMFGTYSVINIVVLLNLLIAMMNHSYQLISERADIEWKFARSKLWISYFEEGGTAPPPFNIIPTPKSVWYMGQWLYRKLCGHSRAAKKEHMRTIRRKVKQASERDFRYQSIMRNLVRRYVTVEQRKAESEGVTEDDVNEIKQDISALRCELIEILKNSGMNTSTASGAGTDGSLKELSIGAGGKKNRQKERRLMKGFNIAPQPSGSGSLPPVDEFTASLQQVQQENSHEIFGSTLSGIFGPGATPKKSPHHISTNSVPGLGTSRQSRRIRGSSKKKRWENLIEAAKVRGRVSRLIGRSRSEDSVYSPASEDGGSRSEGSTDSKSSLETPGPEVQATHHSHHAHHSHHHEGHHMFAHGLGALVALRKKRKNFSDSRATSGMRSSSGTSPIYPITSVLVSKVSKKQQLQRASSVPARGPELGQQPIPPRRHEGTQSQQPSIDTPEGVNVNEQPVVPAAPLTPSTTEESVVASSSLPATMKRNGSATQLQRLPGIEPISGHDVSGGWL